MPVTGVQTCALPICRIFTDDKELLRERITRSASRKAALELAGLEAALAKQGFTREAKVDAKADSPSPSVPAQQPRTASRALHPLRPMRLSQRLARAFTIWAAHVKHAIFARFMRPAIRHTPQRPHNSQHHQPSNHISI